MEYCISIIIAVYNCRDYIRRCIDSAIDQHNKNYEIIIVDDGSTDGTSEICDEYRGLDRITIIHQTNQGHSAARKRGIREAKGRFICFLDSDDWIDISFVSVLEEYISTYSPSLDIIAFNYNRIDNAGCLHKIKSRVKSGYYNRRRLESDIYPCMLSDPNGFFYTFGVFPTLWSKAFRKEIIADAIGQVDNCIVLGEDVFCVYQSLLKAETVLFIDNYVYNYRFNPASLTHRYAKENFGKLTRLCELMDRTYPSVLVDQVRRYKLSMLMGAITNETRGPLEARNVISEFRKWCKMPTFRDCIYNTIVSNCPLPRRIMWIMLKLEMYRTIVLFLRLFRI